MVRYLRFKKVVNPNRSVTNRRLSWMSLILVLFIVPSLWSAFNMIRSNNFERNVRGFIAEKRVYSKTYLYDYRITRDKGRKVILYITGNPLSPADSVNIYKTAGKWNIRPDQLRLIQQSIGLSQDEMNGIIHGIYEHTDYELTRKGEELRELKAQIDSLYAILDTLMLNPTDTL